MATSKTLAPTNVTISIPAMTDAPDASVFSNCVDKEADAINALNSQTAKRAEKRVQGGETASFTFSSYNTSALIFGTVGDSDAILYIFSNGYLIPAKTSSRLNVSLSSDYKTITVSVVSGTGHIGCISANLQPTVS